MGWPVRKSKGEQQGEEMRGGKVRRSEEESGEEEVGEEKDERVEKRTTTMVSSGSRWLRVQGGEGCIQ